MTREEDRRIEWGYFTSSTSSVLNGDVAGAGKGEDLAGSGGGGWVP